MATFFFLFWSIFPQNCMKMNNFWAGRSTSARSAKHCLFSRIERLAPWRCCPPPRPPHQTFFNFLCFYQIFGKYRVSISCRDSKYTVRNPATTTFLILFLRKFWIKVNSNNYFGRILRFFNTNLKEKRDRFQYTLSFVPVLLLNTFVVQLTEDTDAISTP